MIDILPGVGDSFVAYVEGEHRVLGAYLKDLEGFYRFIPGFVSMDAPMLSGLLEKLIELNAIPDETKH